MIEQGEAFYHKRQRIPQAITETLAFMFAHDIEIGGEENLTEARRQAGDKNMVFVLNHLSNFDTSAFLRSLKLAGCEEIIPNLIFFQGVKLDRNPISKFLIGSVNKIKVWPTSINAKAEKKKGERITMIRKSLECSKKALNDGYNLVIYAEGTRSRSGGLQQAESAVAHFFELVPDTTIMPVAICGTEKILPPGSPIPIPSLDPIAVNFGQPIRMDDLSMKYSHLPRSERRKETIDFIMGRIAQNLPSEYRGKYATKP